MKAALALAVGVLLGGCATARPLAVGDIGALSFGNRGSIFGAGYTTIYPDDSFVVTNTRRDGPVRETRLQAPRGTFTAMSRAAAQSLMRLPARSAVAACPDHGTDFIEVASDDGAILDQATALCRDLAMSAALMQINRILTARLEASGR